jgi:predicted dehydrogenase
MIGVAVIGLGAIGRFHARTLACEVPDADLVMVVDADRDLADRAATELGVRASAAPDEALADPDVRAVVIAAPTPLHTDLIERAAAAGVHVFCEKPAGLDVRAVERAAGAVTTAGLRLQVGFQRRFDAGFLAAKHKICAGAVGRIQLLRIAHRNRTPPHDGQLADRLGSIFVDMTVHDLDSARWLVGDIREVSAFEQTRNTVTVLRFENGALGVVDNSRYAGYGFECSAEVVGTEQTLRIGRHTGGGVDVLCDRHAFRQIAEDNLERHGPAYVEELRHFVRCVEVGAEPCVGADDAIAALELALQAERSAAS